AQSSSLRSLLPYCAPLTFRKSLASGSPWRHLCTENAHRLGPRSLRSRGPRRRAFLTSPPWSVHYCPRNSCAPPAAQDESGGSGSDSSENGSESAQF
ncbi:hypothetical protein TYRP_012946, partial [Tyrophagus putrescentiae]